MTDERRPQLTVRELHCGSLRVDHVVATAPSDRGTEPRAFDHHLLVLPYEGLFTTHFGARIDCLASSSDALTVPARTLHHYSYPGRFGDRCIALAWDDAAVDDGLPAAGVPGSRLLGFDALLERERFRRALASSTPDPLEIEVRASRLVQTLLGEDEARGRAPLWRGTARQRRAVDRVRAAVAADPARAWTLQALGDVAALSPHHLARVFQRLVGDSPHQYVLRVRLAASLARLTGGSDEVATIAADLGFASHSHFTARFRMRFGVTPQALRGPARTRRGRHAPIATASPGSVV